MLFSKTKSLKKHELDALRATNGLLKQERYKLEIISNSLGSIYKGQVWCKTQNDIVAALEYAQSSLIRQFAAMYGYPEGVNVDIDLRTGKITSRPVETKEDNKE